MSKRSTSKTMRRFADLRQQKGSFLVAALIMIVVITGIGLSIASLAGTQYQHTKRGMFEQNALLLAEAGIEQSVRQLNTDDTFAGYSTAQEFFNNNVQGRGTFTTLVTDNADGKSKTIVATANVYRAGNTTPYLTRKVQVTVQGTESNGYSVHTGPGGLILGGHANITNSHVFINGTLTMNGSSKIGTVDNPVDVEVANMACPAGSNPGPTYPQVCTDGSQPITFDQNADIFGTVCATGQTSTGPNNNIQTGNGGQGLKVGCVAAPVTTPSYDRAGQIAAVTTTKASTDSSIDCTKKESGIAFTRTWPANLKITGNVDISSSCDLTITGDTYITGNLTIGGSAKIRVADSLGTTRPVIMVDGTISTAGSGSMLANSSGTGIEFISFKSSASCSPNCTSLSGTDLKTSQDLLTVDISGSSNLPGMVFYAYWGKVRLAGGGNVGAIAGQTVDMSGSGTVIFGTELSSGQRTWSITSYQELPNT